MRRAPFALLLATLVVATIAGPAEAGGNLFSDAPADFPTVDGHVSTVLRAGDTAYIGGQFSYVGMPSGAMALLSAEGRTVTRRFRDMPGSVSSLVPDGDGGWYAAGPFGRAQGHYRDSLAHFLPSGDLDPD